jgi:hypothetical protein
MENVLVTQTFLKMLSVEEITNILSVYAAVMLSDPRMTFVPLELGIRKAPLIQLNLSFFVGLFLLA